MTAQRSWRGALAGLLLLGSLSCSETDEQLVDNVGVTVLFLVDSGLTAQEANAVDDRLQVAEWSVIPEDAVLGKTQLDIGGALVDPLFGEPCFYADTSRITGSAGPPCSSGLVIESSAEPVEVTLTLILGEMQVRRGEPRDPDRLPPLPEGPFDDQGDFNDGVPNAVDNCPFEPNLSQKETIVSGVGDACLVFDFFRGWVRDSDGDGIADFEDNCVWDDNTNQADTEGLGAQGIQDGIGDACNERTIPVFPKFTAGAGRQIKIVKTTELLQGLGQTTFLTVDFDSADALNCDWDAMTCELDETAVKFCTHTSVLTAQFGC